MAKSHDQLLCRRKKAESRGRERSGKDHVLSFSMQHDSFLFRSETKGGGFAFSYVQAASLGQGLGDYRGCCPLRTLKEGFRTQGKDGKTAKRYWETGKAEKRRKLPPALTDSLGGEPKATATRKGRRKLWGQQAGHPSHVRSPWFSQAVYLGQGRI